MRHNYIGTEHILLGLLREEEGLAARVLELLNVTVEEARAQVARIVGVDDEARTGQIPFSPEGKKVLELSLREALSLGHRYIGTEHVLLGLVRVEDGVGAQVLAGFGADAEKIRNEIIRMLSGPGRRQQRRVPVPFVAESPPLAPDVVEEIERVRREKEEALERREFERAASLRDRERKLVDAAYELTRAWKEDPVEVPTRTASAMTPLVARRERRRAWQAEALLAGSLLFGVAGGLGVLLAWLIWG